MINRALRFLPLLIVLLGASSALAQRDLKDIPDPDPEIERRSFIMAPGFEANLFAADPLLAKPIEINFDSAGRLWVACSEVYPQIAPGQVANDKILTLEDADGDGKADRTVVFAAGLLIPTGVEPGDGGAYVANSTELVFYKDSDGDGKADLKRVVLSGFGTEDTHHILHTLRWGYDGMLYMSQSIYIHSSIETPWGLRTLGGGGAWRFRPESMKLGVFYRGLVNPWGLHFDAFGQHFATDGAGGEGINYVIPGASYAAAPDAVRILAGLNPGSPKYCGLEVVGGSALPDDWQGDLITNDFRANRVCRFRLSDDGAGFASRELPELIKTSHRAFRPIDVKLGPDGAIYIADWYNPIIQHGEVDFRDPRRDHVHGRIWRITAKDKKPIPRPKLASATETELLDALRSPEPWTRHFAKRVLKERGAAKVLPALETRLKSLNVNDKADLHHLLEALWTYQSIDVPAPELLNKLLHVEDARVRAAAVRVAGDWTDRLPNTLGMLAEAVKDAHPRVRLEAVRIAGRERDPAVIKILLGALEAPMDRFLDYAVWLSARESAPYWLPELRAGRIEMAGDWQGRLRLLGDVGTPEVVAPIVKALGAGKVPESEMPAALGLVAALGGPGELASVFKIACLDQSSPELKIKLWEGLLEAHRRRGVQPEGDLGRLADVLRGERGPVRRLAARAAGVWKAEAARPALEAIARDAQAPLDDRLAGIRGVEVLGGPASSAFLAGLFAESKDASLRRAAVESLTALDLSAAAPRAMEVLRAPSAPEDVTAIVSAFLGRRDGANALAKVLADAKLPEDSARLALRALRGSGRNEPALGEALVKASGITPGPRALSPAEMQKTMADVMRLGDPGRGEAIFRRSELNCLNCHAISGAGGRVGPSLESLGASAQVDYLVDSILQPNAKVKENYNAVVVATSDGKVATGIPIRKTADELVLRDSEDREIAVPIRLIDEQKDVGSIMPVGLVDTLTRPELLDLTRFLAELGRPGPYAVPRGRFARRWQTIPPTPEVLAEVSRSGPDAAPATPSVAWKPAYAKVSGGLPIADLPVIRARPDAQGFAWARFEIDVSVAGGVRLAFNSTKGLALRVDDQAHELAAETDLDLPIGRHVIRLKVDPSVRTEDLRVELVDRPGSPAGAEIVTGK